MDHILLDNFEGPMDLLLHLVKQTKLDIYEVNISKIIEQYLDYINKMQDLNIDVASEYLVMAADLVHIKSKKLVNSDDIEDEENAINSEDELKQRLVEYERFKNISDTFRELEEKRQDYYTKLPENISEYKDEDTTISSDLSVNKNEHTEFFNKTINNFYKEYTQIEHMNKNIEKNKLLLKWDKIFKERQKFTKPLNTSVTKKELSVTKRISYIRDRLREKKEMNFFDLFEDFSKEYVIVTFLSILDMSKNKEIEIVQKNNFDNILIKAGELHE